MNGMIRNGIRTDALFMLKEFGCGAFINYFEARCRTAWIG